MLTSILFYSAISVISGITLLWFLKSAPFGWEDKTGFHFSKQSFKSKEDAEKQIKNKQSLRKKRNNKQ